MRRHGNAPRTAATIVALAATFAAGTVWLGWLAVPIVAVLFGLACRTWVRCPGSVAALAAATGWGVILCAEALRGTLVALAAEQLAELARAPTWVLPLVTLLFPALLAGCAASVTAAIHRHGPGTTSSAAARP